MSAEWHYARDGHQYGPFTAEEFRQLANNRGLRPDDLVWREGLEDWKLASSVRGLFTTPSPSQPLAKVEKSVDEKFCHECGAVIRAKAEICPKCGVRQPSSPNKSGNYEASEIQKAGRLRISAAVTAFLLAPFGVHKFVLGRIVSGIFMFLVSFLTCGYGVLPMWIIGIIEGIIYLTKSDEAFHQQYVVERRSWF